MADSEQTWAEDARLVARVRDGELGAFQDLFTRHRALVFGLACRMLNDREEANDICQEVFLTVHRRLETLREPDKLRAWLCRITLTRVYNTERSLRRRLRFLIVPLDDATTNLRASDPRGDPERALVAAEARKRLDLALGELPFAFRTVVVLRDVEGLSYEEIAVAVDANLGTVKSRLARGREILRGKLRDLIDWHRETRSHETRS